MERQPICKTFPSGSKAWLLDGKYHRTDGPACEYPDGTKAWLLDGKYHRTDGPACEYPDGTKEWYLDGKKVPWQQVYHRATTDEARLSILVAALTTS